MMQPVVFYASV